MFFWGEMFITLFSSLGIHEINDIYTIEDAMRRDTAAPSFLGSAFRDSFRQVALAGLCLPILWLILFDLGRSLADFVRTLFVFVDLRKAFAIIGPKRVFQNNNKSINNSIKIAKDRPTIDQKSTKTHQKSIGIDSGKRSVTEAQRGTNIKMNI